MSRFESACQLDEVSPGVFARDIDQSWYGWNGQFGGYVMALVLEASRMHLTANVAPTPAPQRERVLSAHFLRRFPEGRFRAEVHTERAGRTVTNLSFRLYVDDRLCGFGAALFGSDRHAEAFQAAEPPDLTLPAEDEVPQPSPIPATALTQVHIWPRHEGTLMSGTPITESGGWMALKEPGGADERFLFTPADGYVPMAYIRFAKPAIGGTLELTAHFREPVPRSIVDGEEPVYVRLRTARAALGYIDEDAELWSADGRLLMQTRQVRYSDIIEGETLERLRGELRPKSD